MFAFMPSSPSRSAAGRGVTRLSGNPARAGQPAARPAAPEGLHLACRRQRIERPLHGALAGAERQRQGRARPGFAVGEEGQHRRMLLLDRPRQHDDLARAARHQRKALRWSRSRRPAAAAPPAAARSRPAAARDAIRRRAVPRKARAMSVPRGTSAGHASPSARASANSTGRLASETTCRRCARHGGRHRRRAPSRPAGLRRLRAEEPLVAARDQARRGRVQDL